MDAADVFRQGLGSVIPRAPQQQFYPRKPPLPAHPRSQHPGQPLPPTQVQEDGGEGDAHRIAHTLTACCRCRQVSAWLFLIPPHRSPFASFEYVLNGADPFRPLRGEACRHRSSRREQLSVLLPRGA